MTTIQSRRRLHLFTGAAALALTLILTACGGGGGGGSEDPPQAPVVGNGVVTTLAGDGTPGFLDGTGTAAQFNEPRGITSDGTNLYIADTHNHSIRKIVIATGEVTTFAGDGTAGFLDAPGTAAQFGGPEGITTDGTNLYVADTSNERIRQIDLATGEVTTLAGSGHRGFFNGSASAAQFGGPQGITTDGTNLYVSEYWNHSIRKIDIATGEVTTLAGDGTQGFRNGTGTAARFAIPEGITTDGTNLYVADYLNNRIRKVDIATGEVTTLTGGGIELPAGITTDGTNLYVADASFDSRISQIVIATGEVTRLAGGRFGFRDGTGSTARFQFPERITTDGTDLYVADTDNNRIRRIQGAVQPAPVLFASDRDGNSEIYVMNADGTGQTNLTNDPGEDTAFFPSPDRSKILFTSDRDGNREIYVMNADGTGQTNLTNDPDDDILFGLSSAWSPDGTKILFASFRDVSVDIYVMNADGTGQTQLTSYPGFELIASWSPDGTKIVFNSFDINNSKSEIYVMNADGSGQTNITNDPANDVPVAWSPDGSKILFASNRDDLASDDFDIYVMNADGTGPTNLTNVPGDDFPFAWSPDGTKILFQSSRDDLLAGNHEIYVMNADGTGQSRLTNDPGDVSIAAWTPDGAKILFGSDGEGNHEIYVMNADGTGQTNLTNDPGDDFLLLPN